MDSRRPSFPNPPLTTRFPPPFYPPPNHHHHHNRLPPPPPISLPPPPNSFPHNHNHNFPPPPPPHRTRHPHHHQPSDPNPNPNPNHIHLQRNCNYGHNLNNRLDFSHPPPPPPRVSDRLAYDDDRRDFSQPPPPPPPRVSDRLAYDADRRDFSQPPPPPPRVADRLAYDADRRDFSQPPPPPPRVSDRLAYDDDRRSRPPPPPRAFDAQPYRRPIDGPPVWDPPRAPVDLIRRISRPAAFDRDPPPPPPPPPPCRPSFQPVDRPRGRKEFDSDGGWCRADELWLSRDRRDGYISSDRFERDRNGYGSAAVEQFSGPGKGRGEMVEECVRWDHLPRGAPHSPTPNEMRNGFYEKGKNHVLESDRIGDRDRWDDLKDFDLTPRKKLKRKNALLRIQPSFRNDYERSPSLCRDREPLQIPPDHRLFKERERSPIVSFKSNLLIVAPSSSGAAADDVSAFGDGKNRSEVLDNKDDTVSLSDVVVEKVLSKVGSDNHCGNGSCSLGEQEVHLEKKSKPLTYVWKVKSSISQDLPVGNSEALSNKTESSKSPDGKVLGKIYAGPGKDSSPSFRKKRKMTNPHSSLSSSQVLKKGSDSVSLDNLVNSSSSEYMLDRGLKDSGKDLPSAVVITKPTVLAAIGSSKNGDEKRAVDSVSVGTHVRKIKRRKIVNPRSCSSIQLTGKPDEIPANGTGPIQGGEKTSNSDGAVEKIQKGSSFVNNISNKCLGVGVVSLPHQQGLGSSGATPSVERFIPFSISTRRTTKSGINKTGCANVLSPSPIMNRSQLNFSESGVVDSASGSDGVSVTRPKKVNFVDIVKEASETSSSQNGVNEKSMNTTPSEQDSKNIIVSSSEEFHISEIPDVSCCKEAITLAADNVVSKNLEQLIIGPDSSIVNDVSKVSCMDRLSASVKVGVIGGFPESERMETNLSLFPAEGSSTKNNRKRKGCELHRGSGKTYADGVSLTLGHSIDSDLVQDRITGSGITCPNSQVEPCIGDCISMNGSEEKVGSQETGISVTPSVNAYPSEVITSTCDKKIKGLASQLGSAHMATPEICEKTAYSVVLPCDADVPPMHALPVVSSAEAGLSVSELATPSDLAQLSKGFDLNYRYDASAQVSADLKLVEACGKESSNLALPGTANVSDIPDEKHTSSVSEYVSLPQGDGTLLMTGMINNNCAGIESGSERSICKISVAGGSSSQYQCTGQNSSHPDVSIVNADVEPLIRVRDMECDIHIPVMGDLSSRSEHLSLLIQATNNERATNSSPLTDNDPLVDSPPENLCATPSLEVFDVPNLNVNPIGKLSSSQKKTNGKSTLESGFFSSFSIPSTSNNIVNFKMVTNGIANSSVKTIPSMPASQSAKEVLQCSSSERKMQGGIKNELNLASSKALSSRSSFVPSSGRRPTTVVKSRTWHRTDNPTSNLPPQSSSTRFLPRQTLTVSQTARAQSSAYVRKGNSLLRNPVTAVSQTASTSAPATSVIQLNLSASVDAKNTPCEKPEKVLSPCNIDSSNCNPAPVGDPRCSPVSESSMAAEDGSQRFPEDMPKSLGNCEVQMSNSLEDQASLNQISHSKRMVYIKHKSNQLVASPNASTEISASNKDLPASMSDVYFKRKKNQLVRATPETQSIQTIADPHDGSISDGRRVLKSYLNSSSTKKNPNRGSQKIHKSSKFSLVWKLCNTRSPKKGFNSVRCQQVLPHLLPWKRATYWRSLSRTSTDLFKNSPLSHKLVTSRKRHIIYKRSGFSLRRSKVVSLAGSSLKWSISLEKRSTELDKEAKLAVDSLGKGKREKSSVLNNSGIESKNSLLYVEHSTSGTVHQVKHALKPSTPRRRLIGSDEYVRMGNGNQLIRNPKRRTRILASEKVRWSLHTARMRLAKKRKYCQFFTRFGKCNKEEGKCPYIHDPSKNAVCTKFLNGLCSDPKCKLTHKVIPERMPDCSFFLQGTCSNESCPYRHVSVNLKAAVCGSFLKGYCAQGNECRKKHSYSCPVYDATGECPEGSRCKLYHSRKGKDKKGKSTSVRKNTRSFGRYFTSRPATGNNAPETEGCGKRFVPKDESLILEDGSLADFITLDVSDEEDADQEDEANRETNLSGGEHPTFVPDDPDELIKPIRLLRIMSRAAKGQCVDE